MLERLKNMMEAFSKRYSNKIKISPFLLYYIKARLWRLRLLIKKVFISILTLKKSIKRKKQDKVRFINQLKLKEKEIPCRILCGFLYEPDLLLMFLRIIKRMKEETTKRYEKNENIKRYEKKRNLQINPHYYKKNYVSKPRKRVFLKWLERRRRRHFSIISKKLLKRPLPVKREPWVPIVL